MLHAKGLTITWVLYTAPYFIPGPIYILLTISVDRLKCSEKPGRDPPESKGFGDADKRSLGYRKGRINTYDRSRDASDYSSQKNGSVPSATPCD